MTKSRPLFALSTASILMVIGCGGGDNNSSHIKIETIVGIYSSPVNFKSVPEGLSWMHSLGVNTYSVKCGFASRGGGVGSSGSYIEFEIDSFNLQKATASGEFHVATPESISERGVDINCG